MASIAFGWPEAAAENKRIKPVSILEVIAIMVDCSVKQKGRQQKNTKFILLYGFLPASSLFPGGK
ncbi:MAG: hypothetical protein JWM28_465 [Chitinophagaceae bacterium]|nr:hypothetical protein [Chitinophagaceae bacterium]